MSSSRFTSLGRLRGAALSVVVVTALVVGCEGDRSAAGNGLDADAGRDAATAGGANGSETDGNGIGSEDAGPRPGDQDGASAETDSGVPNDAAAMTDGGSLDAGECVVADAYCDGQVPMTCPAGAWEAGGACFNRRCEDGACGTAVPDLTPPCEFVCVSAATPVCDAEGACVAGPAACTSDDAGDNGTGDDGPAAARTLTGSIGVGVQVSGAVCNSPSTESDWYSVTIASPGEGLTVDLSSAADLDLTVFDDGGRLLGMSARPSPEQVVLSHLPAGTYYAKVALVGASTAAAVSYTVTATRSTVAVCVGPSDCDDTYATQVYRGSCSAGACVFIAPGSRALGDPCDSNDDCGSNHCSYAFFESDAGGSVCTTTCSATADCASLGAGYACTEGLSTNRCVPVCSTHAECGANVASSGVDPGEDWDYLTCNGTTGACAP